MSNATSHGAAERPRMSNHDFRRARHIDRNTRLRRQIRDLIAAHPPFRYLGTNTAVECIAHRLGFEPHDMVIADVHLYRRTVALIVVPHRLWNRPYCMGRLIDLRHQSRQSGHDAILMPQSIVEREPRLSNSTLIAGAARVQVNSTARMSVLAYLIENGPSCLSELAELVDHKDPFGCVLQLASAGIVGLDMSKAITPTSIVDIARPAIATQH